MSGKKLEVFSAHLAGKAFAALSSSQLQLLGPEDRALALQQVFSDLIKQFDVGLTVTGDNPVLPLVGWTAAEVEQAHILATLDACGNNRTIAAETLGISVRGLRLKLKAMQEAGAPVPKPSSGIVRAPGR